MAIEAPSEAALDLFDNALDAATHAVMAEFEWLGLPDADTDQRTGLLHEINDALSVIMREWL